MSESIYREWNELPLTTTKLSNKIFRYFESEKSSICPVCDRQVPNYYDVNQEEIRLFKKTFCAVFNRHVIRGFWWWKKFCPIPGSHWHLKCPDCFCIWIVKKTDEDHYCEVDLI